MTAGAEDNTPQEAPQSPAASQPGFAGDEAPTSDEATGPAAGEADPVEPVEAPVEEPVDKPVDELAQARQELSERTADLQRLQAEYLNYKRRVDRDRELVRQNATYAVLSPVLDVLDTIDRAREHGELEGGFKAVAEQLERAVAGLGLTRFGEPGDAFDPTLHEALSHIGTSAEVDTVTCQHIVKAGYRFGDRVVRAAQAVVVDPEEAAPAATTDDE